MITSTITRTIGALGFIGALSGCVDITMELQVVDETHGVGNTTMVMDREFYDMNVAEAGGDGFCDDDGVLTVTAEAATCVTTLKGTYDELFSSDEGDPTPTAISVGPDLVRVTFPSNIFGDDIQDSGDDPESLAMMQSLFEGRTITLKVSGGQIVDTNMDIAADGQSASLEVAFMSLVTGEDSFPDETFAVVKLN